MSRAITASVLLASLVVAACSSGGSKADDGATDGTDAATEGSSDDFAPTPGVTGIGDPCLFDSDCPTNTDCVLFCSRDCTTDTDCAGGHAGGRNAQGVANHCVQTLNETTGQTFKSCFPGCNDQNDCNPLGLMCQPGPSATGGTTMVCARP